MTAASFAVPASSSAGVSATVGRVDVQRGLRIVSGHHQFCNMDGIPDKLLDMMRRYGTLEQGNWNAREAFEYQYEVNEIDGLLMFLARLRGNLFVTGFAVSDATLVDDDENDWIKPSGLLSMVNDPHFKKDVRRWRVTRNQRLSEFNQGAAPVGNLQRLLCEDHNGTYLLPFRCEWRDECA